MLYNNMELHNVAGFSNDFEGNLCLARLPDDVRLQMEIKDISLQCSGVEIRFKLLDDEVKLILHSYHPNTFPILVFHGCFKDIETPIIVPGRNEIIIKKPSNIERLLQVASEGNYSYDTEMVRVLLMGFNFAPPEIEGKIESPHLLKRPSKTYLAYGSSITSGSTAVMSDLTYPARTGFLLGAENLNLGFSGSAKLERPVADYIASLKGIDYISMELGVNMIWDMEKNDWGDVEEFSKRVEYFIPTIAEAHKDIPIVCTDIFLNSNDHFRDKPLFDFRDAVREVAIEFERKNKNFVFADGKDLLNVYDGLTTDLLHPSALGMLEISDNLSRIFKRISANKLC
ncbi:MAG: SGNH/GDSL hydrolase family protein [Bacillota bacterium]